VSVIPGGAGIIAAQKVVHGALGKLNKANQEVGGALRKGGAAITKGRQAVAQGSNAIRLATSAHHHDSKHRTKHHKHHSARHRHHRRDLEGDEELSLRDLDAEELFGREYDDFLAERDFFDDLD